MIIILSLIKVVKCDIIIVMNNLVELIKNKNRGLVSTIIPVAYGKSMILKQVLKSVYLTQSSQVDILTDLMNEHPRILVASTMKVLTEQNIKLLELNNSRFVDIKNISKNQLVKTIQEHKYSAVILDETYMVDHKSNRLLFKELQTLIKNQGLLVIVNSSVKKMELLYNSHYVLEMVDNQWAFTKSIPL